MLGSSAAHALTGTPSAALTERVPQYREGDIGGVKSAGRTIVEPGISTTIAVLIALLIAGNFSIVNLLVGGLVPFGAGVLGGWLGERKQGTT